ncbi:MAG: serine hydrolase [Pseudomonadota bacterium]
MTLKNIITTLIFLFSTVACGDASMPSGAQSTNQAEDAAKLDTPNFVGEWRAVAPDTSVAGRGFIQLDIAQGEGPAKFEVMVGGQEAFFQPDPPACCLPTFAQSTLKDGVLTGAFTLFPDTVMGFTSGEVSYTAKHVEGGLWVTFRNAVNSQEVLFKPADSTAFRKFTTPRLAADGSLAKDYTYSPPKGHEGLEGGDAQNMDIDVEYLEALVKSIMTDGEAPLTTSVLLIKDEKLVLEEYFYGNDAKQLHPVMSVTKSFISLAVGQALNRGELDTIDKPIIDYFPEHKSSWWGSNGSKVTPRHLLRMANVIGSRERLLSGYGQNTAVDDASPWFEHIYNPNYAAMYFDFPVVSDAPAPYFSYDSTSAQMVGALFEREVGETQEYINQHILTPLGEEGELFLSSWFPNDGVETHADAPKYNSAGLWLTPRGMSKVGLMTLNGGKWNGEQVVPRDWIEESTAVHAISWVADDRGYGPGYGYYWWHTRAATAQGEEPLWIVTALGFGGQTINIIPSLNAVFVTTGLNYYDSFAMIDMLLEYVLPALSQKNEPYTKVGVSPKDIGYQPLSSER